MNVLEKILEEINHRKQSYEEELKVEVSSRRISEIRERISELKWMESVIALHMKNDGWIPVTERLPEDVEYVLVTVNGRYKTDIFEGAIMIGDYSSKFEEWIIEGLEEWKNPNVTAWMPLPEPYKAE